MKGRRLTADQRKYLVSEFNGGRPIAVIAAALDIHPASASAAAKRAGCRPRRHHRRLLDWEKCAIGMAYRDREPLKLIAYEFGCSESHASRIARASGARRRLVRGA
jgi:hypothetical protein